MSDTGRGSVATPTSAPAHPWERPGARSRVLAWCLFDFGNSAFTTVIVTTVFSVYFVKTIVPPGGAPGELLFSICTSVSLLLSAFLSPILGALADARDWKRTLLIVSSLACMGGSAMLSLAGRGDVALAMSMFILANVGFELGYVFYNGFLPEIAPPEAVGRISGYGWATGYIGGMLSLVAALFPLQILLPPHATAEQVARGARISFLLVSIHFLIFAMPAFLLLKDRRSGAARPFSLSEPFQRLGDTVRNLRRYREAAKFILASLIYNDGVVTIFFFAGIYMDRVLGMSQADIIKVVLWINVPSALGSFAFGYLNDRLGGKSTILITLAILIATVAGIVLTAPGANPSADDLHRAQGWFWIMGTLAGLGIGANQSASRGLMSRFIPEEKHAEFFGFFIFSGKLSSVGAPLTWGVISAMTGNPVLSLASVTIFLLAGGVVLMFVDEAGGIRAAETPQGAHPSG